MKRTYFLLIFGFVFTIFSCNAMEQLLPRDIVEKELMSSTKTSIEVVEDVLRKLGNTIAELSASMKKKYHDLDTLRTACKKIKLYPVTTITALNVSEWVNTHPTASGIIASTILITSVYGTYTLVKNAIRLTKRNKKKSRVNKTSTPTKTQTTRDATSTDE